MRVLCATALIVLGAIAACGYSGIATSGAAGDAGDGGELDVAADVDAEPIDAREEEASVNGDFLEVTTLESTTSLDIDAEGTLGWIHWGASATYQSSGMTVTKATMPNAIPTFMLNDTTGQAVGYPGYVTRFTWMNGTGTPLSGSSDMGGVYLKGAGNDQPTFHLEMRVGMTGQRLILYAGLHDASATLTVKLGDGATATAMLSATQTTTTPDGNAYARWGIDFRAAQPDTPMTIDYQLLDRLTDPTNSNIVLAAATLLAMP